MKETEDEVPGMKDARTLSLSSSTCDPFYHSTVSPPPSSHRFVSTRRFAWDKGSGHGDNSNRIWLSAIFIRPPRPFPPLPISLLRERALRLRGSSCGGSGSREFSLRRTDRRTETRELDPPSGLLDLIYVHEKWSWNFKCKTRPTILDAHASGYSMLFYRLLFLVRIVII